MPMFMKWDGKEPEVSTPSVSEITVTKLVDSTSPLFDQGEFFISDGTSNTTATDPGDDDDKMSGGELAVLGDHHHDWFVL